MAEIIAVCISDRKGIRKHPVPSLELRVGQGILGDAHAGNWHRQVKHRSPGDGSESTSCGSRPPGRDGFAGGNTNRKRVS